MPDRSTAYIDETNETLWWLTAVRVLIFDIIYNEMNSINIALFFFSEFTLGPILPLVPFLCRLCVVNFKTKALQFISSYC
jgi:hypothetical protein